VCLIEGVLNTDDLFDNRPFARHGVLGVL